MYSITSRSSLRFSEMCKPTYNYYYSATLISFDRSCQIGEKIAFQFDVVSFACLLSSVSEKIQVKITNY